MPFVVLYMHMHVDNYAFCYQKITSRSNSTNPLPSTQCHGHDPEAADLTVYLAITVSTFYFFYFSFVISYSFRVYFFLLGFHLLFVYNSLQENHTLHVYN